MKSEALDAMTEPAMRPSALEAATTQTSTKPDDNAVSQAKQFDMVELQSKPQQPSVPFGQPSHGTVTAAKVLEDVAHGVKVTVDEVVAWAEKKVEKLGAESEATGPYSQATCVPSDLDPIGSGVLAAIIDESSRKDTDEEKNKVRRGNDNET